MESTSISFRLRNDVWARYSAAAQARGVSLATYLRSRFEQEDRLEADLASLRRAVENATNSSSPADVGKPPIAPGVLVEMLLLLRSLVGPQKAAMAQKEVERRGLETWR